MRILVTGAGGNASQNFVASLRMSSEAFYVVGTDTDPRHLECSSLDKRYLLPRFSDPSYGRELQEIVRKEKIELVHPQPDPEVQFLARHAKELGVPTFLPDAETVTTCQDKFKTYECLKNSKVQVPRTFPIETEKDIPSALKELQINENRVWLRAVRGAGSKAALPIQTVAQAEQWIDYWRVSRGMRAEDFILSEFLPGPEFAFQSLWWRGDLVSSMARERIEYLFGNIMPSGQSSSPSIARTVHRADVNEVATRAVRAVSAKPHGVFCVDLKENARREPCVTEINAGRFFTTSNFFSAAGLNMPYHYFCLSLGKTVPPLPQYNGLESDLFWVRGVDREPRLFRGEQWTARRVSL